MTSRCIINSDDSLLLIKHSKNGIGMTIFMKDSWKIFILHETFMKLFILIPIFFTIEEFRIPSNQMWKKKNVEGFSRNIYLRPTSLHNFSKKGKYGHLCFVRTVFSSYGNTYPCALSSRPTNPKKLCFPSVPGTSFVEHSPNQQYSIWVKWNDYRI